MIDALDYVRRTVLRVCASECRAYIQVRRRSQSTLTWHYVKEVGLLDITRQTLALY